MSSFATWLRNLPSTDQNLGALRAFAALGTTPWPYWSDDPANYLEVIRTIAPAADRDRHIDTLIKYYGNWRALQSGTGVTPGKIVLIVVGLIFGGLIILGLYNSNFYASLGQIEQVRGLVTFLFVLVTTSIILVFALGIFWVENCDDMAKRLLAAKDLLTVIVGIVGTIMGFYFGSAVGEASGKISISTLSPPIVRVGDPPATVTGHINGGAKPYKYSVAFKDPSNTLKEDQLKSLHLEGSSTDGTVSIKITPPQVQAPVSLTYELAVTDDKNAKGTSSGTLYIELKKP